MSDNHNGNITADLRDFHLTEFIDILKSYFNSFWKKINF